MHQTLSLDDLFAWSITTTVNPNALFMSRLRKISCSHHPINAQIVGNYATPNRFTTSRGQPAFARYGSNKAKKCPILPNPIK